MSYYCLILIYLIAHHIIIKFSFFAIPGCQGCRCVVCLLLCDHHFLLLVLSAQSCVSCGVSILRKRIAIPWTRGKRNQLVSLILLGRKARWLPNSNRMHKLRENDSLHLERLIHWCHFWDTRITSFKWHIIYGDRGSINWIGRKSRNLPFLKGVKNYSLILLWSTNTNLKKSSSK